MSMRVASNQVVSLKYKCLSERAYPPFRASSKAAGFDLRRYLFAFFFPHVVTAFFYPMCSSYSAYDYTVPARGKQLIGTELSVELPHECYGRVAPRSGLAVNHFIDVGGS